MAIKCLGDRVLIEVSDAEAEKQGSLYIPDTAKEKPQEGKIVSVGPGARDDKGNRIEMEVKAGDKVLYSKYSGTEVKYDGKEYLIVKESDILAVLN